MTDRNPPARPRSALFVVFLVVVIDLLGFGIVLPLLPLFATDYVKGLLGDPKADVRAGLVVGLLMASFSAMQFFFAPVWGRVSDRVGRRPILLLGLGASVAFYALFGFASDLPRESAGLALALLFAARIGAGVAGATIATAQAVIADCTPPDKRKHGMALIGAAFGIGFTFGPLLGFLSLLLFPEHRGSIGYAAAGLSALAFVLGVVLMPETRDFSVKSDFVRQWFDLRAARHVLSSRAVAPVVLTFFLASLGFASFEVTLAKLNSDVLQLKEGRNFLIFAYVGFVLALTQGFLYRRAAKKMTEPALMTIGLVLMGLGVLSLGGVTWLAASAEASSLPRVPLPEELFGVPMPTSALLQYQMAGLAVAVIGFAFLTPSAQALVSRRSDPARQGEILGVNQSCSALARILGPVLGLTLYEVPRTRHMLPYLVGAGLLLAMLTLIPRIRRGDPAAVGRNAPAA